MRNIWSIDDGGNFTIDTRELEGLKAESASARVCVCVCCRLIFPDVSLVIFIFRIATPRRLRISIPLGVGPISFRSCDLRTAAPNILLKRKKKRRRSRRKETREEDGKTNLGKIWNAPALAVFTFRV